MGVSTDSASLQLLTKQDRRLALLGAYASMKAVVVKPTVGFAQSIDELGLVKSDTHDSEVIGQVIATLQRKKRKLGKDALAIREGQG